MHIRLLTLFLGAMLLGQISYAQSPQAFKYQAVVRDANGAPLANGTISFRGTVRQGSPTGSIVFQEVLSGLTTNDFGLIAVNFGETNATAFAQIDWADGPYFFETEIDPTGSGSYSIAGTSQLQSVPMALFANEAVWSDSSDHAQVAGMADFATQSLYSDTATYAWSANSAMTAQTAVMAQQAMMSDSSLYAQQAGTATQSMTSQQADQADTANYSFVTAQAISSNFATFAQEADSAYVAFAADNALSALTADSSNYAQQAGLANFAVQANASNSATVALEADSAHVAGLALAANYADTAGYTPQAGSANLAQQAISSNLAAFAQLADSASAAATAVHADTADYARNTGWEEYAVFTESYPTNNNGPTYGTNSWNTVQLNTTGQTQGTSIQRSGTTIQLDQGTYYIDAHSIFHRPEEARLRVENVTSNTTELLSLSQHCDEFRTNAYLTLNGIIAVPAGGIDIQVQAWIHRNDPRLGTHIANTPEIFSRITIRKID